MRKVASHLEHYLLCAYHGELGDRLERESGESVGGEVEASQGALEAVERVLRHLGHE